MQAFAVKFDVNANKDKSGIVHRHKHMKVCSSTELEEAVNVRGTNLLNAATKLARHMGIEFSDSSYWVAVVVPKTPRYWQ